MHSVAQRTLSHDSTHRTLTVFGSSAARRNRTVERMEQQPPSTGATRSDPSRDSRHRQLVAGAVAVVLTALTAVIAVSVNFGAASAQVPSEAGRADRTALENFVDKDDRTAGADAIWGRPPASGTDAELHEQGHDDDD